MRDWAGEKKAGSFDKNSQETFIMDKTQLFHVRGHMLNSDSWNQMVSSTTKQSQLSAVFKLAVVR